MKNPQPLAEVFGHLPTDSSERAKRHRDKKLCPFNNKVPNCTKDKAQNPLGVCSINHNNSPVITCPIRFREDWIITDDASEFFFSQDTLWTSLTEVRLNDKYGKSAGNIDVVLVAYDEYGKVHDFGALEIQAVYISGNVRSPFNHYMSDCITNSKMDWTSQPNFPYPDFLSSSKRLVPQLLYKGGILHEWKKKVAVAVDSNFFDSLPQLEEVDKSEAEIAWLIYDLCLTDNDSRYKLKRTEVIYTKFRESLNAITSPRVGCIKKFMKSLQEKVDEELKSSPTNKTIDNPMGG